MGCLNSIEILKTLSDFAMVSEGETASQMPFPSIVCVLTSNAKSFVCQGNDLRVLLSKFYLVSGLERPLRDYCKFGFCLRFYYLALRPSAILGVLVGELVRN